MFYKNLYICTPSPPPPPPSPHPPKHVLLWRNKKQCDVDTLSYDLWCAQFGHQMHACVKIFSYDTAHMYYYLLYVSYISDRSHNVGHAT